MTTVLESAILSVFRAQVAFCKFITANDAGKTGSHQSGFHIHKDAWPLMFSTPGTKGSNKEHLIEIYWQSSFKTSSRFKYYGKGTRNEYRLTRFGKKFPFLDPGCIGSLLILTKQEEDFYEGFVLETDEGIEQFMEAVSISMSETNRIINKPSELSVDAHLEHLFNSYLKETTTDFPDTESMSQKARQLYNQANNVNVGMILRSVDLKLTSWVETEYNLFKYFEANRYKKWLTEPMGNLETLVSVSNTILQRRKSRAGKSLENHLDYIFKLHKLVYERNAITENNKKPDFLFPSREAYLNFAFPTENLIVLGAKTTCKDRWRQVVGEANRLNIKYLCTLQQGNTENQLSEMYDQGIRLVVPRQYINAYPKSFRNQIFSIDAFIQFVKRTQN